MEMVGEEYLNMQEHLLYITELIVKRMASLSKVKGVMAEWGELENTAYIAFYFDDQPTENELEDASDACGEIIAHCSNALLHEDYIRLESPLPESPFWAYKRPENFKKSSLSS